VVLNSGVFREVIFWFREFIFRFREVIFRFSEVIFQQKCNENSGHLCYASTPLGPKKIMTRLIYYYVKANKG
jgi:hypothetical protein